MKKLIALLIILTVTIMMVIPITALGDSNVALNKQTQQSSTAWSGSASRAVDGNTDGGYGSNSVTHSEIETNHWWEVDLGVVESIHTIRIWNRTDCCADRLNNFNVFVSDLPFSSTDPNITTDQDNVITFFISGIAPQTSEIVVNASGRFVRVQIPGHSQTLSLAEVEVLKMDAPSLSSLSLSEGNLYFQENTTLYTTVVPSSLSSLTLTPAVTNNRYRLR